MSKRTLVFLGLVLTTAVMAGSLGWAVCRLTGTHFSSLREVNLRILFHLPPESFTSAIIHDPAVCKLSILVGIWEEIERARFYLSEGASKDGLVPWLSKEENMHLETVMVHALQRHGLRLPEYLELRRAAARVLVEIDTGNSEHPFVRQVSELERVYRTLPAQSLSIGDCNETQIAAFQRGLAKLNRGLLSWEAQFFHDYTVASDLDRRKR